MTDKFGRPINRDTKNNIKTSDVTKNYIRDNYIESEMEENINMKNQYYIKNLPNPINLTDATNKKYVDDKTINFVTNDNFDNNSIVRTNKDNDFKNNKIINLDSISTNRAPILDSEVANKLYLNDNFVTNDNFDNNSIVRTNKDNDFNNKNLTNINSVSINRDPILDLEVVNKLFLENTINKIKPVITIWAEENGALNANSFEFSWGNGASSSTFGYPLMTDGRILRASICINSVLSTATIEIHSGGVSIGSFQKLADQNTTITIFNPPLEITQGNFINFKTITETETQAQIIVALLIELDL